MSSFPLAGKSSPSPSVSSGPASAPWSSPTYNGGPALDSDTISYIHRIYCRECRMEEERRQETSASPSVSTPSSSSALLASSLASTSSATLSSSNLLAVSPPGASPPPHHLTVEDASLANAMDKNKECEYRTFF